VAFVATLLGGIAVLAGLNLAVDPFAQYQTGWLPPVIRTSRGEKLAMLESRGFAQGLLVGSSRVMKFEPDYLAARTGKSFLNAGVYYGRPEDFLALLRASHAAWGRWPEMLVVGLDVDAFVHEPGPDARLLRNAALRRHVSELLTWQDRTRGLGELLGWQQTRSSLQSIWLCRPSAQRPADDEFFDAAGMVHYDRRERERRSGTYDYQSALDYSRGTYVRLYRGYSRLGAMRVAAWRTLSQICEREGIELVVFLTTWQADLQRELDTIESYAARRGEVEALVRETLPPGGRLLDFSDLSSYDGLADEFVDGIHPLEPNTRRMIDRLFASVATALRGGDDAVQ
jgi:hypothetical protein